MKKAQKILIITVCSFILASSVCILAAAVYISAFSSKNISSEYDERLFSVAKGGTLTQYYGNEGIGGEYKFVPIESMILSERTKLWIPLSEVNSYLTDGFIAVEDREFYSHSGVNLRRTLYALANSVFHFKNTFGASTITQQVIKNISGDNELTLHRKLSEIIRAYNIEKRHTKEEILELYLNIVPMGENLYGVRAAAEAYFGKSTSALTLAECATLIGITNAPTRYNPHLNPEDSLRKRNEVLGAMYAFGTISETEYKKACKESLSVLPEREKSNTTRSWFIETVNDDVTEALAQKYNISEAAAQTLLYNGGFSIYTTENPKVQKEMESYFENYSNFPREIYDGLDYSMVVCDSVSGDLLGIIGSVGKKNANELLNLATVPRTPGSTLKPLALYAPLIDEGRINWASVFDDVPAEFYQRGISYTEYPKNSPAIYDGLISAKDALRLSKNTVAIKLYELLGAEKIYGALKNKFAFDTLVRKAYTDDGRVLTDLDCAPLALGQLSYGVSLRKLTEAYTVFPSEGVLHSGRSFIYVYDSGGELILDNGPHSERIFSEKSARIMNMMLKNVTEDGTASEIKLKYKVDTAGKTGTSGESKDKLFVGYTPYLTAGIWCGYRDSDKSLGGVKHEHIKIWDNVMSALHREIISEFSSGNAKSFSTKGLIRCDYCMDSGKLYSPACSKDPRGMRLESGYFTADNKPNTLCDRHVICKYDFLTNAIATDKCPKDCVCEISLLRIDGRHFPKEIIISDADYVYRETDGSLPLGDSYDIPYYINYIDEGDFVGIGRKKKQFNSSCYLHND